MPNFQSYHPEQAELLPAHVRDVLGFGLRHSLGDDWRPADHVYYYRQFGPRNES